MNENDKVLPLNARNVALLPGIVTAKQGHQFAPNEDTWRLRELTHEVWLRFAKLPHLGSDFKAAFKAVLVWYAENFSIGYVKSQYNSIRRLLIYLSETSAAPIVQLSSVDILNYKAHIGRADEWRLGAVSGFLKRWHAFGYEGVTEDAVALLKHLRLKGHPTGVAVATMDPITGPFTALEHEALLYALNRAYAEKEATLAEYVLCWMFIALGMRATQYARLKVCDVVQLHEEGGCPSYSVRMPRAKQRTVSHARSQFKDRLLTPQIGKLVFAFARQVEAQFTGIIDDPTQAPLFSNEQPDAGSNADAHHMQADAVGARLTAIMGRLNVMSERTGKPLKVHARRFRMTIGTRAAEEGHGELVIAELLDHSNTANVGVYVRSTPAIVERIDRSLALQLAPLAQAFAGKLINGPLDASRRDDATSGIRAPAITGRIDAISSCGKHGFCGFLKPIACYSCASFEPWLDGPHEQVLTHLLAERARLMEAGGARVAAINDRAILAVAEVIRRCEAEHASGDVDHG
ncbi:site-specific integrase [Paraburkholderia caledonica]|uniref:Integrase n=1 Tax=Paraburkholderia caledonica TaxID=134536 RepID=A0AB73IM19_9BURK|nr:integrase [Paraburkholderia caledonica]